MGGGRKETSANYPYSRAKCSFGLEMDLSGLNIPKSNLFRFIFISCKTPFLSEIRTITEEFKQNGHMISHTCQSMRKSHFAQDLRDVSMIGQC